MNSLKLYLFAVLALASVFVAVYTPTFIGIWMLLLSIWIAFVAANITTVLYAFINGFLAVSFDYYLRWENAPMLFYRGYGASPEQLGLLTTIILLIFYTLDRSSASRVNLYAYVPELNLLFSHLSGWVASFILLGGSFYVVTVSGTIFQKHFDLNEIGRYAFLEYLSLLILVTQFSRERRRKARFFFSAIAVFYTFALVLASYRMAATLSALALLLGLMSGKRIAKYKILGVIAISFLAMGIVGLLRHGQMEFGLLSLLGYKHLGSFGFVLDSTFTGVIETSLIYTSYSESLSLSQTIGNFLAIIAPVPSSMLPDSLNYHGAAKAFHQTRVPGGGIVAGYVLFTKYLLMIPLMWFFVLSQTIKLQIEQSARLQHNSIQHVLFAILMITMMRWSLYGVYVLFKFMGIFFLVLLVDAGFRSLAGRRPKISVTGKNTQTVRSPVDQ
jgi:hypothetical protein